MDAEKLAEAIIARIEHDRAIHKSSLVDEIQRAMNPSWVGGQTMPNMLSDGTITWECASINGVLRMRIVAPC